MEDDLLQAYGQQIPISLDATLRLAHITIHLMKDSRSQADHEVFQRLYTQIAELIEREYVPNGLKAIEALAAFSLLLSTLLERTIKAHKEEYEKRINFEQEKAKAVEIAEKIAKGLG